MYSSETEWRSKLSEIFLFLVDLFIDTSTHGTKIKLGSFCEILNIDIGVCEYAERTVIFH